MKANLAENIARAHLERAQRADATLIHAQRAPALFKPEFVRELADTVEVSLLHARYWAAQAV